MLRFAVEQSRDKRRRQSRALAADFFFVLRLQKLFYGVIDDLSQKSHCSFRSWLPLDIGVLNMT